MTAAEIAQELFRGMGARGAVGETLRFVAVRGHDDVRWLLPAGEANIEDVLASWTPYRFSSQLGWAAARAATRLGCVGALPGTDEIEVAGPGTEEWRSLGWRWKRSPLPVIYLGTPGARRKAVMHLVERESGKCRAVVKVPLTEQARAAILHEAEVLEALNLEGFQHAPTLLQTDRARGLATQTFFEGRPSGRKLGPEHWRLLRSLLRAGESTSLPDWAPHWARAGGSAAAEMQDDTPMPACWEHGDFTPWNIRRGADGECVLLDWEQARRKGLPLMDAFHFLHMQDFLFGQRPRLYWASFQDEAMQMGVVAGVVRSLEMAYLARASAECISNGNGERLKFVQATTQQFGRRAA
jgi:hypothetical protein